MDIVKNGNIRGTSPFYLDYFSIYEKVSLPMPLMVKNYVNLSLFHKISYYFLLLILASSALLFILSIHLLNSIALISGLITLSSIIALKLYHHFALKPLYKKYDTKPSFDMANNNYLRYLIMKEQVINNGFYSQERLKYALKELDVEVEPRLISVYRNEGIVAAFLLSVSALILYYFINIEAKIIIELSELFAVFYYFKYYKRDKWYRDVARLQCYLKRMLTEKKRELSTQ